MGMFENVVLVALAAAFIVVLVKKWGIAEWMQVHGDRYMYRLFSCDFCMSFWTCVLICCVWSAVTDDMSVFVCPALSTPLARMMV